MHVYTCMCFGFKTFSAHLKRDGCQWRHMLFSRIFRSTVEHGVHGSKVRDKTIRTWRRGDFGGIHRSPLCPPLGSRIRGLTGRRNADPKRFCVTVNSLLTRNVTVIIIIINIIMGESRLESRNCFWKVAEKTPSEFRTGIGSSLIPYTDKIPMDAALEI